MCLCKVSVYVSAEISSPAHIQLTALCQASVVCDLNLYKRAAAPLIHNTGLDY